MKIAYRNLIAETIRKAVTIDELAEHLGKPGDIVVAIEDDGVPQCVLEKNYDEEKSVEDYDKEDLCRDMFMHELEEIEEGEK